ncbi:DUF1080 domain-containing protein [Chloroflexi bacterium TSY]|nr:DUF1080 domain-containing protein [Chloroflexi bacterium TSY]
MVRDSLRVFFRHLNASTSEKSYCVISIDANAGIFLRMPKPTGVLDEAFYARCIEIQIDERGYDDKRNAYGSSLHKTGAVYNLLPARQWASKVISPRFSPSPGYWNAFEVLVEDNHVTVKPTTDSLRRASTTQYRGGRLHWVTVPF